jgi:HAD superfamily hydrolase (TIGR01549 family)
VKLAPRALSLDLDDTLWPIWPVIERAEAALDVFLRERCPRTAAKFPMAKMRELRNRVADENPHIAHDFTRQRKLSLLQALRESGDDEIHAEDAFDAFYSARNAIEFFPDAMHALTRLAARLPVAALTNGNADLQRIGISMHFAAFIAARDEGHAKPDAPIFHAACARLNVAPHELLHVGDDPELDIAGAQRAGLRSCWINRKNDPWPEHLPPPELEFTTLTALADWLDAQHVPLEHA